MEGRCDGQLFDCRDVSFTVGEGEDKGIPLGVDRAMDKMQKGERCVLHLQPKYALGFLKSYFFLFISFGLFTLFQQTYETVEKSSGNVAEHIKVDTTFILV